MYTICRIEICGHGARRAAYTIRATRGCIGHIQLPHFQHSHGRKKTEPICYANIKWLVNFYFCINLIKIRLKMYLYLRCTIWNGTAFPGTDIRSGCRQR